MEQNPVLLDMANILPSNVLPSTEVQQAQDTRRGDRHGRSTATVEAEIPDVCGFMSN